MQINLHSDIKRTVMYKFRSMGYQLTDFHRRDLSDLRPDGRLTNDNDDCEGQRRWWFSFFVEYKRIYIYIPIYKALRRALIRLNELQTD